jgi:hypothetical protein
MRVKGHSKILFASFKVCYFNNIKNGTEKMKSKQNYARQLMFLRQSTKKRQRQRNSNKIITNTETTIRKHIVRIGEHIINSANREQKHVQKPTQMFS